MTGVNFCTRILEAALQHPDRLALSIPRAKDQYASTERLTYAELILAVADLQHAISRTGLRQGERVLLLARPSIRLYVLILALFGLGLVPVLVEKGMSRKRLFAAIRASGARTAIGDRELMRVWWLFPVLWHMRRYALDGKAPGVFDLRAGGGGSLDGQMQCVPLPPEAHGLITFTSGSTGLPKGADRTHGSLIAQHLAIRDHWPDQPDDIDSPCFPVLVLHNLCCGISTVMPATDLSAPGQVQASRILSQLEQEGITRVACSPAYLARLLALAESRQQQFPRVRSLVVGGSTLTEPLIHAALRVFPNALAQAVYGSTEAEPIAGIPLETLLKDWDAGAGHLVGPPAHMAEVAIVNPDRPLTHASILGDARQPTGVIGEILVAGYHVLQRYIDNPAANRENKIPRPDGQVWHRTGDAGYLDQQGRLWLTGRIKDALILQGERVYTFDLEKALDALPGILRSALVGLTVNSDNHQPVLVLDGDPDDFHAVQGTLHLHGLREVGLAYIESMPVDGRHNSKIDRPRLREMLREKQLTVDLIIH